MSDQSNNTPQETPVRSFTLDELYKFADEPTPWLIEGLIPESELVLVYGIEHIGKTYLLIDLGLRMTAGLDFWGHPVNHKTPRRVLYAPSEGRRGFRRRLGSWLRLHIAQPKDGGYADVPVDVLTDPDIAGLPFFEYYGDDITDDSLWLKPGDPTSEKSVLALKQEIARVEANVLIVDVASDFSSGVDENAVEFGHAMKLLHPERLAYQNSNGDDVVPSVFLVHHEGKGKNGPRGSSKLANILDVSLRLEVVSENVGVRTVVKVENPKNRSETKFEPFGFILERPDGLATAVVTGLLPLISLGQGTLTLSKSKANFLSVVRAVSEQHPNSDGVQISTIAEKLGVKRPTASDTRNALEKQGYLRIVPRGRSVLTPKGEQALDSEVRAS